MKPSTLPSRLMGFMVTAVLLLITWAVADNDADTQQLRMQEEFEFSARKMTHELSHEFLHLQKLAQHIQSIHAAYPGIDDRLFMQLVHTHLDGEEIPDIATVAIINNDGKIRKPLDVGLELAVRQTQGTGLSMLTERLTDAAAPGNTAGTLYAMVVPVFSQTALPPTGTALRAIHAWVILKFDANGFASRLAAEMTPDIGIEVFDKPTLEPASLIYRNATDAELAQLQHDPNHAGLRWEQSMPFASQQWVLVTYPRATFFSKFDRNQTTRLTLLGAITSLVIGVLVWLLGHSRENALKLVDQYTRELQESNADLLAVLEAIPDLMFELDLDGRYHRWWSPRSDLLAAPPEAFLGKRIAQILPPEAASVCHEVLQECLSNGHSTGRQIQLAFDGQTRWFELSAATKTTAGGEPRFIMLSRDITERKNAELATEESERQLSLALQGGELGFWDWRFETGVLEVNPRWFAMLGLDASQATASMKLWRSLIHPADLYKFRQLRNNVILHPRGVEFSVELRARHALGHYIWILEKGAVFSRDAAGKPLRVVGTHMDITASRLDEEQLRLNEYAFKAITQGICIADLHGKVTSVNDAFCNMTGYARAEMVGQSWQILRGPGTGKATMAHIRRTLKAKTVFRGEVLTYKKNGESFWNDLEIAPVMDMEQHVTHYVGVLRDTSDKKKFDQIIETERQTTRVTAEQLRVLSRRLLEVQEIERRRVAHELHDELGQSLTALKINLLSSQNRRESAADSANLENVRIVEETIQQVRRIALALRPSMLDDLGLKAALAWLTKAAAANGDIQVDCDCDMDLDRLPEEVETACFRIVQEALTNVRRHARASFVRVRLQVHAHQLRLEISDNGIGFELLPGLGLRPEPCMGLLGMKERAASIDGTITWRSAPNQGTAVELLCRLPDSETPAS